LPPHGGHCQFDRASPVSAVRGEGPAAVRLPAASQQHRSARSEKHRAIAGGPAFRRPRRAPVVDPIPGTLPGVLTAHDVPGSGSPLELRIAGILRLADAFDQKMEAQPIDGAGVDEILERLRSGVTAGLWPENAMDALVESTRPTPLGKPDSWNVPVFPQAAMRMLSLMRDPLVGIPQVVEAASLDPATAGLVMQLANSALFGARTRLSTLSQAIARLGFATAYKVVTSASLRPPVRFPGVTSTLAAFSGGRRPLATTGLPGGHGRSRRSRSGRAGARCGPNGAVVGAPLRLGAPAGTSG
jgi:hypothetical protein